MSRARLGLVEREETCYKLYTETYFPVVARLRPRSRSRRRNKLHSVARTAARRGGLGNSERVSRARLVLQSFAGILRKQESWALPRFLKVSRAAGAALPI